MAKSKTVFVIDTETTGEAPPEAAVCEIAAVPVANGKVLGDDAISTLVNPGHPIPPECRGVHHLSDRDVAKAPTFDRVMAGPFKVLRGAVIAAHNMDFDFQFVEHHVPKDQPRLCTYRCARHLYPDAPNFRNQTLRYYLDVEPPSKYLAKLAPHRALYDAICTAFILAKMLGERTVDDLIELTAQPVLLKTVSFGQHRGQLWEKVPRDYLRWILSKDFDTDTMHTAKHHYNGAR